MREYPVFGGTLLDYALLIDGQPSLYLEAKKLAASMNDPAFISQTVNYANNDGIRWCVLTNGLVYRIYKSDELASADKKLLAEADLREASDPDALAHVVKTLSLLSKASLANGDLDAMGERVFVDVAVRSALDALDAERSAGLVNLIRKSLSDKYATKQVKASLARIAALSVLPKSQPMPAPTAGTAGPTRGQGWTIDQHLDGKPQATVDLYQQLDTRLVALGNDISRKYLKWYVNYSSGSAAW